MLEAIREASHGKMYLEKEYADATMDLCKYLEEDGKKDEGEGDIEFPMYEGGWFVDTVVLVQPPVIQQPFH